MTRQQIQTRINGLYKNQQTYGQALNIFYSEIWNKKRLPSPITLSHIITVHKNRNEIINLFERKQLKN